MAETKSDDGYKGKDYPILFAIFGLNRAGQILWFLIFAAGIAIFVRSTILAQPPFSEQDEALFRAARHGDRAGVERALDSGALVTAVAPLDRKTALFRAAVFGHADVVKLLLEHGANPNEVDADGRTVLEVVIEARNQEKNTSAAQALDAVAVALHAAEGSR